MRKAIEQTDEALARDAMAGVDAIRAYFAGTASEQEARRALAAMNRYIRFREREVSALRSKLAMRRAVDRAARLTKGRARRAR